MKVLAILAPFPFLRSNTHAFEFSTSGHLVVNLATFPNHPSTSPIFPLLYFLLSTLYSLAQRRCVSQQVEYKIPE
jgi:hypothetical protein